MRRHPALSVVTSAYGVAVIVFALVPWRAYDSGAGLARALGMPAQSAAVDAVTNLVVFLPFGVLVALITGPRRRLVAIVVVALAACWIELAQLVWMPVREPSVTCVIAQCAGGALGIVIVAMSSRHGARHERAAGRTPRAAALDSRIESTVPRL